MATTEEILFTTIGVHLDDFDLNMVFVLLALCDSYTHGLISFIISIHFDVLCTRTWIETCRCCAPANSKLKGKNDDEHELYSDLPKYADTFLFVFIANFAGGLTFVTFLCGSEIVWITDIH